MQDKKRQFKGKAVNDGLKVALGNCNSVSRTLHPAFCILHLFAPPWVTRPLIFFSLSPRGTSGERARGLYSSHSSHCGLSTLNPQLSTIFVPARVTDNAYNNVEYRRVLEGLTGWQRRAWLDGDWDLAAGQFFTSFRRDVHVVEDFDETRAREWFAALDYGYAHYTVVLLGCTDGDGNLFVVDEHAERLWLPQRHAAAVRAMVKQHGVSVEQPRRFVAGADVFSRQSDGTTIAAQYAREGITLKPANMDRVNGRAEVLQRLDEPERRPHIGVRAPSRRQCPAKTVHSSAVWAPGGDFAGATT